MRGRVPAVQLVGAVSTGGRTSLSALLSQYVLPFLRRHSPLVLTERWQGAKAPWLRIPPRRGSAAGRQGVSTPWGGMRKQSGTTAKGLKLLG